MASKYTKRVICLANSRKLSGRCVAGKVLDDKTIGEWIRPVGKSGTGELTEEDRRFADGKDPEVLVVIRVPMAEPRPDTYQVENHLIDDGSYWEFDRRATQAELRAAVDNIEGTLWPNGSSSYNGLNDRVAEVDAAKLRSSLCLIEVKDLEIAVGFEGPPGKQSGRCADDSL